VTPHHNGRRASSPRSGRAWQEVEHIIAALTGMNPADKLARLCIGCPLRPMKWTGDVLLVFCCSPQRTMFLGRSGQPMPVAQACRLDSCTISKSQSTAVLGGLLTSLISGYISYRLTKSSSVEDHRSSPAIGRDKLCMVRPVPPQSQED
jgi:hypothetical protein